MSILKPRQGKVLIYISLHLAALTEEAAKRLRMDRSAGASEGLDIMHISGRKENKNTFDG